MLLRLFPRQFETTVGGEVNASKNIAANDAQSMKKGR